MKPKTIALMVVAIGCGLVASYMTSKLIADRSNNQPAEEKVPVVVAKKRVNKWVQIRKPEELFEVRDWPKELAPAGALHDVAFLKDKRLSETIKENKPVSEDQVLNKDLDGLAAAVNPGSRAVAIKVNAESMAGGFVLPGSLVDIVATQTRGDLYSAIILQNMTVLAVDQVSDRKKEDGSIAMVGTTVTLAAQPEEATRLRLAQALGELSLLLRGAGDTASLTRPPVTKPEDLRRPLHDPKEDPVDPDTRVADSRPTTGVGMLPEVKPPPPETEPKTEPKTAPEPVKQPEVKTHVLTIQDGPFTHQVIYVWDEDEKKWRSGTSADVEEARQRDKPAPSPSPSPSPSPGTETPRGTTPTPTPTPTPMPAPGKSSNRVPSTRTN